jgi:CubicO group peptidase (beta-lactamase class C family)
MTTSQRRSLQVVAVVAVLAAGCTAAPQPEPDPAPTVEETLPFEVADYLDRWAFLEENVRAVVMTVDGDTVLEEYRDSSADEYHNIASVTKSVLSTLVGIAVDEGLLDLDATLAELLPQYASTMSPDAAATTPTDLLTMTGPFPNTWNGGPAPEGADWVGEHLAEADRRPGTFAYSDPGVDVLAAVLARATGTSVLQYGREKLFDPLGIDSDTAYEPLAVVENFAPYQDAGFAWPVDPQGVHLGGGGLKLRAQDLVRLGTLYLEEGRWEGRQVVSAEWVRSATTAQAPSASGAGTDYGYLWWVEDGDDGPATFLAWGFAGQLLEVVPELGMVAVVQTEMDLETPGMNPRLLTPLVDDVLVPAAEAIRDSER